MFFAPANGAFELPIHAILGIALSALAIIYNQPWTASIIASVDLTGLVAVFVIGSRRNQ